MEPTYTILGGDGQQYGPISIEQLRAWAREGRVNGDTQVWRTGSPAWAAASTFPELGIGPSVTVGAMPAAAGFPAPSATMPTEIDPELGKRISGGASWFFWIGALSLINSIAAVMGSDWRFFIGLGITQLTDLWLVNIGTGGKIIALVIDVIIAGTLVLFGVLGAKRHGWAMIVGAILLAMDSALVGILALAGGGYLWICLAFHVWAVFMIFRGFLAIRAAKS
jgi:hypothetical protein